MPGPNHQLSLEFAAEYWGNLIITKKK